MFFAWETFKPFFQARHRRLHAARNLTLALANVFLVGACCAGATVATAEWTALNGFGLLSKPELSPAARLAAGFLLLDLWTYWWHRANHRLPLLWRFHRTHHSDPSVDVTTAMRFHTGELVASANLRLLLVPAAGLPLGALALYDGVVLATTQFHHVHHANVGIGDCADGLVRRLVVSPNMHKVHHSRRRFETDSNYATLFSGWDRLFGAYRERRDCRSIELGLENFEDERFQTLKGLALTPFRRA